MNVTDRVPICLTTKHLQKKRCLGGTREMCAHMGVWGIAIVVAINEFNKSDNVDWSSIVFLQVLVFSVSTDIKCYT